MNNVLQRLCVPPGMGCAIVLGALPIQSAQCDIIVAEWTDDEHFSYQVQYMPDLDQKRGELADDGSVHCVPTSTMNMFAYAAEWGFEDLPPGPGVYQGEITHVLMSFYIGSLGQFMGTGPAPSGTGVNGWLTGSAEWIEDYPFIRTADYRSGDYCPTLSTAAHAAACGSLVSVCYGRFLFNPSGMPVVADDPESGHCVTMMRCFSDGPDSLELWVRDPADSGDSLFVQSPWSYRIYDPVENMFIQHDWDGNGLYTPHEVTVLEYNPKAEKMAIFYKVYQLTPEFGYSFDTVQLAFNGVAGFDFTNGLPPQQFSPEAGTLLLGAVLHPNLHSFIFLQQGSPNDPAELVLADRATGVARPMFESFGINMLTMGRNRDIYLYALGDVLRVDIDNPTTAAAGGQSQWFVVDSFSWGETAQSIGYNDRTDEVYVLSTTARKLLVAPQSLGSEVEPVFEYAVPTLVPSAPQASMAFSADYKNVFVCIPSTHQIFQLEIVNPGPSGSIVATPIALPGTPDAESIDVDDRGHLLVTEMIDDEDAKVFEYEAVAGGSWERVKNSRYANLVVKRNFRMARSRSNFDPDINTADENVIPAEELPDLGHSVYDCPGDFVTNATFQPPPDGQVDGADLAFLLGEWGPNPGSPADIVTSATFAHPPDGFVDGADLGVLLTNWGECN